MDPIELALTAVVLPGAAALVLVSLAAVLTRKPGQALRDLEAPKVAGFALAAGFGLGFMFVLGWPALPPVDVTQAAPWMALFAAPLAFFSSGLRAVATAVLGVALGLFLAGPLFGGAELVAHAALIGVTVVAMERGLTLVMSDVNPRGGAIATLVFVSGAAAVILMSDTASLALVTGGLAAGLGALFTAGFVLPGLAKVGRAAPVIAVVLATHLHGAALFAGGRYDALALVVVAPLALAGVLALVGRGSHGGRGRSPWVATVLPAALILVPLGAAGAVAASRYFAEPAMVEGAGSDDAGDDDYGY